MNVIECQKIGMRFSAEENWIFHDLNLTVAAGESIAILGPSGSGKSVFLKILAGLITPSTGQIKIDPSQTGMLFQKNALFDSLTVEENLLFPLREKMGINGNPARQRARELLKKVELQGCEELSPSALSGGMQRRLGIARAWAVEPKILLYDDPSAGLDPITSRSIADLILEMQKNSAATLVTVTNDIPRAMQLSDHLYLLAQGKLSSGYTPEEAQKSTHPALRQFLNGLKEGPLTTGLA